MFIELHIIQNFPISCINRDDTNTPKTCEFGGYRRARISSQCIKRAVRWNPEFKNCLKAIRSKLLKENITDKLIKKGLNLSEIEEPLKNIFEGIFCKLDKEGKSEVLLFIGDDEIEKLANVLYENWDSNQKKLKKEIEKVIKDFIIGTKAPDIALFGRMVASNENLNVDAACQVAHAFSTNKIEMEMDFFTALDEISEETGAGMMGTIECNSSCYYRYSLIDYRQLLKNLQNDKNLCEQTVEAFIRASVVAIPTGKITTFANNNPPDFVFAVVRENGMPCNLANAFIQPIKPDELKEKNLIVKSIEALDEYWGKLHNVYGNTGIKTAGYISVPENCDIKNITNYKSENLEDVIVKIKSSINDYKGE